MMITPESPYERWQRCCGRWACTPKPLAWKTYVSAARWEEMQRLLPGARLVDCTELMAQVRWVKTPGEIQLLKPPIFWMMLIWKSFPLCALVRRSGTCIAVWSSCLRRGAQWVHGILNSSRNAVAYGGEGDTVFQAGDIIRNDYVSYYHGYPGHQSRGHSGLPLGRPAAHLPYYA